MGREEGWLYGAHSRDNRQLAGSVLSCHHVGMWVVGIKIGLTALSANTFPHRTIVLAL